ncbi:MAG: hypothetical protein JNM81_02565 [Rhodospirillaceae bacterium]|nr:hypothetical protein [Rhodospirillaceae bacterium]
MRKRLLLLVAATLISAQSTYAGSARADDAAARIPVQSLLLRAVTVTCKLDESIAFYRDVLNQRVLEDSVRDGARVSQYVDIPISGQVRLVLMGGSGSYPGGDIMGGHIAFIGITEPKKADACRDAERLPKHAHEARAKAGDVLFSMRVANLDEVAARAAKVNALVLVKPGPSGSGQARNMMMMDPNGRIIEAFEISSTPQKP